MTYGIETSQTTIKIKLVFTMWENIGLLYVIILVTILEISIICYTVLFVFVFFCLFCFLFFETLDMYEIRNNRYKSISLISMRFCLNYKLQICNLPIQTRDPDRGPSVSFYLYSSWNQNESWLINRCKKVLHQFLSGSVT